MSFLYLKYLPVVILSCLLLSFLLFRYDKRFAKWIEKYWFYKRSLTAKLSILFLIIGFTLLSIACLDLRGPEQKVSGNIPDQRTVVLIDTSSSMLAEDVRPSRFDKSIMLARHFVKNAVGHQISINIFSDTVVSATPFTDDISFLDTKLSSLDGLNLRKGGTSLVRAINESVQVLKAHAGGFDVSGNILVFTDSEDNGDMSKLMVPDGVNLALVGVGTLNGAKIPVKSKKGEFLYYKKHEGKEIITKLDERTLKEFSKSVKNYNYWVALSYSVPTEEIISFFKQLFKKRISKGEMRIRPVMGKILIIPGMILIALSALLRLPKSFISIAFVFFICFSNRGLKAQETPENVKEEKVSELYTELFAKMKQGKANTSEKLKFAEEALKSGKLKESIQVYSENIDESNDQSATFNYATALIKDKQLNKGIALLKKILDTTDDGKLKSDVKKNIRVALMTKEQKDKNKKKQDQDKDKDKDKDKKDQEKKKDEPKEGSTNKDQKDPKSDPKKDNKDKDSKGEQKKDQKKDQKKKDQQDKDKKQKDQKGDSKQKEKKDKDDKDKKKKKQNKKNISPLKQLEQKEKKIKQKRKMQKIPAIVKQLMDEDKNIMKRLLDTTKQQSGNSKKDW